MKSILKIVAAVAVVMAIASFTYTKHAAEAGEEDAIKELVMKAYVNGAFNELDTKSMSEGFHKDFAIFYINGEEIRKYPIADWVARTEQRKADGYDPNDEKNKWDSSFAYVDVTGDAAQVKIELWNQGQHVFTDYLSLLKFPSGWKIVAKVFRRHE